MRDDKLEKILESMPCPEISENFDTALYYAIQKREARSALMRSLIRYPAAAISITGLTITLLALLQYTVQVADSSGFIQYLSILKSDLNAHTAIDLLIATILAFPVWESVIVLVNVLVLTAIIKRVARSYGLQLTHKGFHTGIHLVH